MHPSLTALPRASKRARVNPLSAGLPDPRPITEYAVVYEEVGGASRITVTLDQPCIIRPAGGDESGVAWGFIDCNDGSRIAADTVTIDGNTGLIFEFHSLLPGTVAFIDVPYQDTQVQNFQGGFVRPGARWFRKPE